jgi:hypothetical protein
VGLSVHTTQRVFPMKKTISIYWPIAMLVPVALAAHLACIDASGMSAASRPQPTAASVSAELARAVSFGYVEPEVAGYAAQGAIRIATPVEQTL